MRKNLITITSKLRVNLCARWARLEPATFRWRVRRYTISLSSHI